MIETAATAETDPATAALATRIVMGIATAKKRRRSANAQLGTMRLVAPSGSPTKGDGS